MHMTPVKIHQGRNYAIIHTITKRGRSRPIQVALVETEHLAVGSHRVIAALVVSYRLVCH